MITDILLEINYFVLYLITKKFIKYIYSKLASKIYKGLYI